MKIIVDAMRGQWNNGRKRSLMAAEEFGVEICLVGKADEILQVLRDEGIMRFSMESRSPMLPRPLNGRGGRSRRKNQGLFYNRRPETAR